MKTVGNILIELDACYNASIWADDYGTIGEAWLACGRGDWLLWLAHRLCVSRQAITLAACKCARLAPSHAVGKNLALTCIEVAEDWARGNAEVVQVQKAKHAVSEDIDKGHISSGSDYASYAAFWIANYAVGGAHNEWMTVHYVAREFERASGGDVVTRDKVSVEAKRKCADVVREMIPAEEIAYRFSRQGEPGETKEVG